MPHRRVHLQFVPDAVMYIIRFMIDNYNVKNVRSDDPSFRSSVARFLDITKGQLHSGSAGGWSRPTQNQPETPGLIMESKS